MSSSSSAYAYLKEAIIADIAEGKLVPGARLPSQRELCTQHGLGHMTERKSIDEHISEGIVRSTRKGLFVAGKMPTGDMSVMPGSREQMAMPRGAQATRILASG